MKKFGLLVLFFAFVLIQSCGSGSIVQDSQKPPADIIPAGSTQRWITQFGTGSIVVPTTNASQIPGDLVAAVVVSADGGVYTTGYTLGSFPGFPANSQHIAEPYLIRFDSSGKQQWVRQFSSGAGDFIADAVAESSGDVIVAGSTLGTFPGNTKTVALSEALIARYGSSGDQLWLHQFSINEEFTQIRVAAIDSAGHLFVAGELIPPTATDYQNFFVAAVDATTGTLLWSQSFGNNAVDLVSAAAVDSNGGLYLSGITSGAFPGTASQDYQPFVVKLAASDGHVLWTQSFPDLRRSGNIDIFSLAIANDGDVIGGGALSPSEIVVGQYAASGATGLLLKLSANSGAVSWQRTFASGSGDQISAVRTGSNGDIYTVGSTNGVFASKFSQPNQDLFLIKTDKSGTPQWVQQFGTGPIIGVATISFGAHIAPSSNGDLYVAGATQGSYPGASNPSKAVEGFVGRFGP